jgi:tRNA wybutosine-synthesizing protein 3
VNNVANWEEEKLQAWRRMWEDLHIGYLDEDILDVLIEIFLRPDAYPKSSCSGRITVIDSNYPWSKDETMTVFKKHAKISVEEIEAVMKRPFAHRLWLSVQGPIYHIYTRNLEEAHYLLIAAREAGFKHSGVMVVSENPLVELRTGIRGDFFLASRTSGRIIQTRKALEEIVDVANEILAKAKERNRRLLIALRKRRPKDLWRPALEKARELGLL